MKTAIRRPSALLAAVLCWLVLLVLPASCGKDPDNLDEAIIEYYVYCPYANGIYSCYATCGTRWDLDGDGMIDPVEQPDYDKCTGTCDNNCSTLPILSALASD